MKKQKAGYGSWDGLHDSRFLYMRGKFAFEDYEEYSDLEGGLSEYVETKKSPFNCLKKQQFAKSNINSYNY